MTSDEKWRRLMAMTMAAAERDLSPLGFWNPLTAFDFPVPWPVAVTQKGNTDAH